MAESCFTVLKWQVAYPHLLEWDTRLICPGCGGIVSESGAGRHAYYCMMFKLRENLALKNMKRKRIAKLSLYR